MDSSYIIKATKDDSGYDRPRIILKKTNYRVWSIVVEVTLRENKLLQHVMGVAIRPLGPQVITPAVAAVAAAPKADVMAGAAEIIQEMVDQDVTKIEDFDAAIAHANSVMLQNLEPKDVMATMMLL